MRLSQWEQAVSELSLNIAFKTVTVGQDQSAIALRKLIQQLAGFQLEQSRLTEVLEQTAFEGAHSLGAWTQLREVEVLLRSFEHHVKLIQQRFQLSAGPLNQVRR